MDKEKETISEVVFPIIKGQFITCTKNQCERCLTPCSSQETANKIEIKLINAGYGNVKKYQDQINDLQAEIERLKQKNRYWYGQAQRQYQEYKAGYSKQAVKEFAEELKDQCRINSDIVGGCGGYCVAPFEIDNLFKKLYGED